MRKLFFIILLFQITGFVFGQNTANLTVSISNIELDSSKVFVGLYNSQISFKQKARAIDSLIIIPTNENTKVQFNNIPTGYYAIAVFQDTNNNGEIDLGKLKIPTEPVGIFNYTANKSKLPPTFKKSKFTFYGDTLIFIPLTQKGQ